jgi:hypothetical protein
VVTLSLWVSNWSRVLAEWLCFLVTQKSATKVLVGAADFSKAELEEVQFPNSHFRWLLAGVRLLSVS